MPRKSPRLSVVDNWARMTSKVFFLLLFLTPLCLGLDCPEDDLPTYPSHFYYESFAERYDGDKLLFRCTNGRVLDAATDGHVDGGYYGLNCTTGNGTWLEPATWPVDADCVVSADSCNATSVITDLPDHLYVIIKANESLFN